MGSGEGSRVKISYCDDTFFSGETRRRVLLQRISVNILRTSSRSFKYQKLNISYMDIFMTDQFTQTILAKQVLFSLRRAQVHTIVWYGDNTDIQDVLIEGIDRRKLAVFSGRSCERCIFVCASSVNHANPSNPTSKEHESLKKLLVDALENPGLLKATRARLVAEICGNVNGQEGIA